MWTLLRGDLPGYTPPPLIHAKGDNTMAPSEQIISLPALQDDTRIRIFRRTFPPMEEFADMHVDAYVIVTERSVVICDTLLSPADMAFVMQHTRPDLTTGRQLLVLNSHAEIGRAHV